MGSSAQEPDLWKQIDNAECYLVSGSFDQAVLTALSVSDQIRAAALENACDDGELLEMLELSGMVLVQALKELRRTPEMFIQLKTMYGSVASIPVKVFLTGATMQMAEGSGSNLGPIFEEYLAKWRYTDDQVYVLNGGQESSSNGLIVTSITGYADKYDYDCINSLHRLYFRYESARLVIMAPTAVPTSSFALRSVLDKEKLNGTNFADWSRNLRIVLRQDKKEHVLEEPIPDVPAENATAALKSAYKKACDESLDVSCLMLAAMNSDLQKQFENIEAYDMIVALKGMFETQARTERYEISKKLFGCKLAEGSPVSPHVIKMVGYSQSLEKLGFPLSQELATDLILASLPASYGQFILNFHMNGLDKNLTELHMMLKTAEDSVKKSNSHVMMVQKSTSFKKKAKTWFKGKGKAKVTNEIKTNKPKPKTKSGPTQENECFYCKELGHWKRNCKKYLADLKKNGGTKPSTSESNKD